MRTEEASKKIIRLVIADDHPIVRSGLREIIEEDPQIKVLAEAGDGAEAVALVESLRPDVVVVDVDMPVLDGFGVVRELRGRGLEPGIVFLTIHKTRDLLLAAVNLGVNSYLVKESAVYEIVAGIKAAAAGQRFVTSIMSGVLVEREQQRHSAGSAPGIEQLTRTEIRVLRLIADYKSTREIAAELFVHHRTIENHRANICRKLELRGHSALLKFAIQNKDGL